MKLAREKGARTVAITNMMGSQITRGVDSVLYTRCGLEVGVAASRRSPAQVSLLYLVALKLAAQIRETVPSTRSFILDKVYDLPKKIDQFLDGDTRSRKSRSGTRTSLSSSISAGTSACRLHSGAR